MAKLPLTITDVKVKIDRLVPGGQGIATFTQDSATSTIVCAGKKAFFWNALPGETVTKFTVVKNKSHYLEAIAEEISDPSPHRIAPQDSCYLATSPWQIMDYAYELEQKSILLAETFRQAGLGEMLKGELPNFLRTRAKSETVTEPSTGQFRAQARLAVSDFARREASQFGNSPFSISLVTDGKDFHYRNKMEYSLYWNIEKSKIELAQHQRGSHRKLPLKSSSIERPEIFTAAQNIVADLNARGEEARKYQSLLLRCDQTGKISGGLYENKQPHPKFEPLSDSLLDHEYSYSPNGFFQINLPVYELALQEIKQHIKTENVLDLYAGVGTIGLSVARDKKLTLVECNTAAFAELKQNCTVAEAKKKSSNILPVLANSEDALSYIEPDQTVILDPPRAGCHQRLLQKLLEVMPQTIVYLSCNPVTQARDLKILLDSANINKATKYRIVRIQPYNFFPRTPHLENLVILTLS